LPITFFVQRVASTGIRRFLHPPRSCLSGHLGAIILAGNICYSRLPWQELEKDDDMLHKTGTREEWAAARDELAKLEAEQAE